MGNQVTTLGQIYPVEYYLANYCNDMTLDVSLGSTRFMKVARVRHKDVGYCVAKVYAINDHSIPIQEHKQKIEQIRDTIKLNEEPSALPFLTCNVDDKCAILLRQYIKYNLYDRLSTRPFPSSIEKRWIAYQLLRCIQSLHKQSTYHGDIKSENVLVTSFLWVTLADFASFKPVVIPANNPSDFSYFFDTSRRHCCNIAPERFVEPPINTTGTDPLVHMETLTDSLKQQAFNTQSDASLPTMGDLETPDQLTAQMDLFSLGCVFAELFSDDTPNSSIFDLGQVLMFKKGQYDPTKLIEGGISDSRVRRLILNLIDLDSNKRNSAGYHLEKLVPSLFPAYFQTLYDYFCKLIPMEPDAKILMLEKDLDKLMDKIITENEHGLLIPLLLATSTLRSLKSTDARLIGLRLCVRLVESSTVMSEYTIDRLLPYIVQLLGKSESRVRALCVSSLNRILKHVSKLKLDDANVFIDYILPSLLPLAYDQSTLVRIALASNIGELAETSMKFLTSEVGDDTKLKLNALQEAFGGIVSQLLVDPNNHVRRAVLNQKISKLCNFFDAEKTDEVILSHIITFLNDKSDFRLRAAFFDNISSITSSLGSNYAPVVKPLLQKGLADSEEIVIYKCLDAISSMTDMGMLTKEVVYELFQDAVLFISFPNKWIRNAVINLVLALSKPDSPMAEDFGDRILPCMKLHLYREIQAIHDASVLLDSLRNPLPRIVIESILNGDDDIDEIFHAITERKRVRGKKRYRTTTNESDSQDYDTLADGPGSSNELPLMTRAESELSLNIDRLSEDRLLDSEETLRRIRKNKRTSSSRQIEPNISIRRQDVIQIQSTMSANENTNGSAIGTSTLHPTNNLASATYADSQLLMSSSVSGLPRTSRPRGILLAHLHEHKGSVNKLVVVPGTSQFISCSSDATIRFWDCAGVSTKPQVLFRSKQTYVSPDAGAYTTISTCMGSDTLLALTECNNLHLLQLYSPSSRSRLIKTINFNSDFQSESELVTELISLSPFTYATCSTSSNIRGYDLRLPDSKDIWNLRMDGSSGLITCMDGNEYCIACGTSSSVISMFDLRFYIRATTMSYPLFQEKMRKRIRRILILNDEIYCSLDGNNEVSTWDCESASRTKTLWASPYPCLSSRNSSHHSVLSMIVDGSKEMNSVITAGDDMKIRFWDLNNPNKSFMVSRPPYNSYHKLSGATSSNPDGNGSGQASQVYYQTKLVDGIQVIQETDKLPLASSAAVSQQQTSRPNATKTITDACDQQDKHGAQQHQQMSSGAASSTNQINAASMGLFGASQSSSSPSQSSQLAIAASTAHRDSINCLATVNQSSLLLSASRDGVIKIWR